MNEKMMAVQRMQDYIADHYREEITIADLAKAAMFSPWYSRRLFLEWTHLTPSDYIRRMRLSESARRLRDDRCKVTDVAMEMGFGSVDGYQRAFFREFGCNPKEYAQNPVPICLFKPYGVKYAHTEREETEMENLRNVFIQIVQKPKRQVILKRGVKATDYWTYCEEVGCDVWGLLSSMPSLDGEPVCLWLPEQYRNPKTNEYVQGVEFPEDYAGTIPEGFEIITLPAATYLQFRGEPFAEEDFERAIMEIWEAENRYQPSLIGYEWDTDNPRIQLEPIGSRGYIELRPVRK